MTRRRVGPTAAMAAAVLAFAAIGARPAVAGPPHAVASLLAPVSAVVPGQPLTLGVRLVLAPGWHTYWRNPGDAGLPPSVSVSVDGAPAVPASLRFPAPERIDEGGLVGFGYTGSVLLPFTVAVRPGAATGPVAITARAEFLVCATVCVPANADLALALPRVAASSPPASPPAASPSAAAPLFAAAEAALPRQAPFRAVIAPSGRLTVDSPVIDPVSVRDATFFPDAQGMFDPDAAAPVRVTPGRLSVALRPASGFAGTGRIGGVLVLRDGTGARTPFAIEATRGTSAGALPGELPGTSVSAVPTTVRSVSPSLPVLLLLALAGGALLNLMPCVFPVLALKALALVRASATDRTRLRRHALGYAAGAVGAFAALGTGLLLLRFAGADIGWGFQFQSPPFVALTALLFAAITLNLAGVFTVSLPLGRFGQRAMARADWVGDVATGALAVVVATPCTAPFTGAALAGALSGPPLAAVTVFASLGVGLALPMLVLAAVPAFARLVPRPGRWTVWVQRVLAVPMAAATVWFLAVLDRETGRAGTVLIVISVALLVAAAAAIRFDRLVPAGVLLLVALVPVPELRPVAFAPGVGALRTTDGAEPYTPARLAALRDAGRPVLVEMSAAWCLTCLLNERVALAPAPVGAAMRAHGVALLRGDWTARDPAITDFLRRFNRDGVPLAVWFPPANGAPEVLPPLLTAGDVLRRVEASG